MLSGIVAVGAIVLVLSVVGFAFWASRSRWLAERGWIFNKHSPRPRGGGTLGLVESIYQPSIEHVIEERASERARGSQDQSGDKPRPGNLHIEI